MLTLELSDLSSINVPPLKSIPRFKPFILNKPIDIKIAKIEKINENDLEKIVVKTTKAEGQKCPVCWKINVKPCERHFS